MHAGSRHSETERESKQVTEGKDSITHVYDEDIKEFVRLEKEKRKLKSELDLVDQAIDRLKESLIPQFLEKNREHDRIDERTVYIQRSIYPAMVNGAAATVAALRKAGVDSLIGVNHQRLAGYVTEIARDVAEQLKRDNQARPQDQHQMFSEELVRAALPEPLREEVSITFKYDLRSKA